MENLLIANQQVDFINIDVAGFEMNVLKGLSKTINGSKPVVVVALNHWCLNAFQRTSIPDFFDYLLSIFPFLFAIDGTKYADLKNANDRYFVMYHHIVHFKYRHLVGAFNFNQLKRLFSKYTRY